MNDQRLPDQLREKIEEAIATGVYPPGMRLDEVSLAEEFGVSRTPLREALFQLAALGFIAKRPRKGWEVATIAPSRLCEMFEVMAELEAMCAKLAARRASDAELAVIRRAHEACAEAKEALNTAEYYRLNEVFHLAIYNASHNAFLIEQANGLHRRLRPYRRLQLRVRDRIPASYAEHQGILDAILGGDPQRATELSRSHVIIQGERFTDLVASLEAISAERKAG
jgi:DNA-binding GntR family transcriptional regulator